MKPNHHCGAQLTTLATHRRSHTITTFAPPGRWKFSVIRLPSTTIDNSLVVRTSPIQLGKLEPWTALLLDDAQVVHETTPIQKAGARGLRDTLVLTFRADRFQAP